MMKYQQSWIISYLVLFLSVYEVWIKSVERLVWGVIYCQKYFPSTPISLQYAVLKEEIYCDSSSHPFSFPHELQTARLVFTAKGSCRVNGTKAQSQFTLTWWPFVRPPAQRTLRRCVHSSHEAWSMKWSCSNHKTLQSLYLCKMSPQKRFCFVFRVRIVWFL